MRRLVGEEEGMHSRDSVEDSDLSETDSEEMDDDEAATSNQRNSMHSDRSNESPDEQYIGHYLQSQKYVAMQDDMPTHLPLKRPLEHDATTNTNVRDSMVSDLSVFSPDYHLGGLGLLKMGPGHLSIISLIKSIWYTIFARLRSKIETL